MKIPLQSVAVSTFALLASVLSVSAAPVFSVESGGLTINSQMTSSDAYVTGAWTASVNISGAATLKLHDDDGSTLQVIGASGLAPYKSGSYINIGIVNKTGTQLQGFKIELRLAPSVPSTPSDGVSFGQDLAPALTSISTGGIGSTVTRGPGDILLFSNINLGRGIGPDGTLNFIFPVTSTLASGPGDVYLLLIPNPAPPNITRQPANQTVRLGARANYSVVLELAGSYTYQWFKDGVPVNGATADNFQIASVTAADVGTYTVRVTNSEGSVTSNPATLRLSREGHYFGDLPSQGAWAAQIKSDGSGQFIANDRATRTAIKQPIRVADDGTLSHDGPVVTDPPEGEAKGAIITGRITGDDLTGELGAAKTPLTGRRDTSVASADHAGYYFARAVGGTPGASYTIVSTSGRLFSLLSALGGSDSIAGTLNSLLKLAGTTANGIPAEIALDGVNRTFEAIVRPAGLASPTQFFGLLDGLLASSRLVNLSILTSLNTSGDTFTLGTVLGGAGTSGNKPLLVRAVGPALSPLGVTGAMPDPRLDLYRGTTLAATNDNWGGSATLSTVFAGVGAFAFASPQSRDAATYQQALAAGSYTVEVGGTAGSTGTVLAELYDATPDLSVTATTPRLVNVSVLKPLATGETLTAGFVISGVGPKQILIRAVGPTLGAPPFNVPGAMADPRVELFAGTTSLAVNDNWGGGATLAAAFANVGAFALPAASRDAALLATLRPGNYTAQVQGAGNGAVLVEVYEVP